MKYMLLIYMEETALSDDERADCYVKSAQLAQDIHTKGQYLAANPLHSISTATSIRVREGKRLVTDGPFAETKEVIGGYALLKATSRDEVVDLTRRFLNVVGQGTCEIYQLYEMPTGK